MKKLWVALPSVLCISLLATLLSCEEKATGWSAENIDQMDLKRGEVITCGPPDKEFGSLTFETSCGSKAADFNLGVELLHSFEYDEAEKVFAKIIDKQPDCAMAYWGVAMSNFHPLWTPPSEFELKKGAKAIEIAQAIASKSEREAGYIAATAAFYNAWDQVDHRTRCLRFEEAMEKLSATYPTDKEATVFYALALNAAADAADKSYSKQKKAGSILNALYPKEPNHPGIIHYLIHTYDSPELAKLALPAARKYASVAPSSAHALHMPSHIFTRLGLWDDCIQSNLASVSSAKCYAEAAGMKGHWDEELHGMDYLVYAYLQKGENHLAKEQWDYLKTMTEVQPINFKVAYAFAAIPARYVLENKRWQEAATLQTYHALIPWKNFPWQSALIHFTRLMGSVHTNRLDSANAELKVLTHLYDTLLAQKDTYKANQVDVQINASRAWIRFKEGKKEEALTLMRAAADMEDRTEKHPVTPGEVIPARELLGDLLMQMHQADQALEAYEAVLKKQPNRFNALYGAGLAAEKSGNLEKAGSHYRQLLTIVNPATTARPELTHIRQFLKLDSTFN